MRLPSTSTVFFVSGVSVMVCCLSIEPTCGLAGRKSMSLSFTLSDLRQRPEFFDTVADRIWRAWCGAHAYPLDYIAGRLRENMSAAPIPFALVAHDGETFLGTVSVIVSDLAGRPQWTPWVAAVWVEPQSRGRGIGGAYLCARPQRSSFYERLGWLAIEREVGPHQLSVFIRDANCEAGK